MGHIVQVWLEKTSVVACERGIDIHVYEGLAMPNDLRSTS